MNVRLATTAVASAAGAVLLAVTPTATAAAPTVTTPAEQAAPNFEAEFPVSVDAQVTFQGEALNLDLSGQASLTIDAPSAGNLEVEASGTLSVSAQHPDLGEITVESKATGSASLNSVLNPFPAELDLSANGTVTIENPGTTAQRSSPQAPLELSAENVSLTGTVNEFPPKGEFTKLRNPIELADGSGANVATVNKFSATIGS